MPCVLFLTYLVTICPLADHDNEEELYFPFLKEKGAKFPEENGMIMSHKDLVKTLKEIKESFEKILEKEGKYCGDEVAYLKRTIPAFGKDLKGKNDLLYGAALLQVWYPT